jgi:3-methyladenine DNA glycosylase AlkC
MPSSDNSVPESGLWKDYLNQDRIETLARRIRRAWSRFDVDAFTRSVLDPTFESLELKDRIARIADSLRDHLPKDYRKAVKLLIDIAPDARGFENWALTAFIERHGLDDFDTSVKALRVLTQYGSAEFAIRPYMLRHLDRLMPILHEWARDDNEHIRRLAAEGSRPRGVWVAHIPEFRRNPRPVIELLDKLKADESLYVRKAVANNLNDISKDHPDLAVKTARQWLKAGHPHTTWIVKHACRSLIKQGHPDVFAIFGFTDNPKVKVASFRPTKPTARIGDRVAITCELRSAADKRQKLAIDFCVHYVKKNGRSSPKVFKWAERGLPPGETLSLSIDVSLREMTTRKHYPGIHRLELVINGRVAAESEFLLRR